MFSIFWNFQSSKSTKCIRGKSFLKKFLKFFFNVIENLLKITNIFAKLSQICLKFSQILNKFIKFIELSFVNSKRHTALLKKPPPAFQPENTNHTIQGR